MMIYLNPSAPNLPRFAYHLRSPYWLNFQESLYNHLRGIRKIVVKGNFGGGKMNHFLSFLMAQLKM